MNASDIGDLALTAADREILWRTLRDRGQTPPVAHNGAEPFPWPDALDALYKDH
jgi:hypothetical protein